LAFLPTRVRHRAATDSVQTYKVKVVAFGIVQVAVLHVLLKVSVMRPWGDEEKVVLLDFNTSERENVLVLQMSPCYAFPIEVLGGCTSGHAFTKGGIP
jgi:hypothetical protein